MCFHSRSQRSLRILPSYMQELHGWLLALFALLLFPVVMEQNPARANESPTEVQRWFQKRDKVVITFLGYSGTGYEHEDRMLAAAREVLSVQSPKKTIVNIGATPDGIGAVYKLAKQMGFETTGIVSTQAQKYDASLSTYVDKVFYVEDESWGGFINGTQQLSPTSQAMVAVSDVVVAIGGGAVARDELIAARRAGKTVKFMPAEMNHRQATERARKKGCPFQPIFVEQLKRRLQRKNALTE